MEFSEFSVLVVKKRESLTTKTQMTPIHTVKFLFGKFRDFSGLVVKKRKLNH